MNLSTLIRASQDDPDAPNISLNVKLSDLRQLVIDTIDETVERLRPLWIEAQKDEPLTRKQVAQQLGVCEGTVHNLVKSGQLHPSYVGRSVRYSQQEVTELLKSRNKQSL